MPKYFSPVEATRKTRGISLTGTTGGNITLVVDPFHKGTGSVGGYDMIEVVADPNGGSVSVNISAYDVEPGQEFWLSIRQNTTGQVNLVWTGQFKFSGTADKTIPADDGSTFYLFHGVLPGYSIGQFLMSRQDFSYVL